MARPRTRHAPTPDLHGRPRASLAIGGTVNASLSITEGDHGLSSAAWRRDGCAGGGASTRKSVDLPIGELTTTIANTSWPLARLGRERHTDPMGARGHDPDPVRDRRRDRAARGTLVLRLFWAATSLGPRPDSAHPPARWVPRLVATRSGDLHTLSAHPCAGTSRLLAAAPRRHRDRRRRPGQGGRRSGASDHRPRAGASAFDSSCQSSKYVFHNRLRRLLSAHGRGPGGRAKRLSISPIIAHLTKAS